MWVLNDVKGSRVVEESLKRNVFFATLSPVQFNLINGMDRVATHLSIGVACSSSHAPPRRTCPTNFSSHFVQRAISPANCGTNSILRHPVSMQSERVPHQRSSIVTSASTAAADHDVVTSKMISVAHALADAAASVTTPYFRTAVPVDVKTDSSPVTIADREAETAMRSLISSHFPDHAIFGEEQGYTPGNSPTSTTTTTATYMWVIDPIDGTKSFITGKPLFGTLISLLHHGRPVLGIIDQPILKERWLGVAGQRTTLNGAPISTRPCSEVAAAYLYATTPHMFSGDSESAFNRLRDSVKIPLYGCDCYAYGLLAAGHCDIVAEADLKPYDYMALIPVITGAGGVITDWCGNELRWSVEEAASGVAPPGEVLAAGDGVCHRKALALLNWK